MNNIVVPHPDSVCKGSLAKLGDIKPGVVLWHVYGHLPMSEPSKVKILQLPQSYRNMRFAEGKPLKSDDYVMGSEWVFMRDYDRLGRYYDYWTSLGDCGIGSNHNTNRLLLTPEAAMRYHKAALAWNDANPDYMGRCFDDDHYTYYWDEE